MFLTVFLTRIILVNPSRKSCILYPNVYIWFELHGYLNHSWQHSVPSKYIQDWNTNHKKTGSFLLVFLFSSCPWGKGEAISEASKPEHLIFYYSEGLSLTPWRSSLDLYRDCPGHDERPLQYSVKKPGLPREARVTQQTNYICHHSSTFQYIFSVGQRKVTRSMLTGRVDYHWQTCRLHVLFLGSERAYFVCLLSVW